MLDILGCPVTIGCPVLTARYGSAKIDTIMEVTKVNKQLEYIQENFPENLI